MLNSTVMEIIHMLDMQVAQNVSHIHISSSLPYASLDKHSVCACEIISRELNSL